MKNAQVPILGFAAFSGTGKTTLLTQLIPQLNQSNIRVGLIKHSHHNFEIDKPGKDSYQLRKAGASPVMLVSSHRRAIITEFNSIIEPSLNDQLQYFDQSQLDLILVEGFKAEDFPKIEIHRPSLNKPLLFPDDPKIIAIATDDEISIASGLLDNTAVKSIPPVLDLNHIELIADFILKKFITFANDRPL